MIFKEKIIFGEDYIQILDINKKEIAYWTKQEWIDEPNVVFSICNAVYLASKNELSSFLGRK